MPEKGISCRWPHVWTMDGGKAVAFQQHVDTVKVRELS